MKKHAPATLRNREAILAMLRHELPEWGTVLEVASGSGEHAVYFAEHMSALSWQPSDPDAEALASIEAYRAEYKGVNLRQPILLDASKPGSWELERADALLCCNMVHISPWAATVGLFEGGAHLLDSEAPLIVYGPFFENDAEPAPSNQQFNLGLRSRDERWGIRQIEDVDQVARQAGFTRSARHEMPANNLILVYRRD
ncbi:MAG: DUF938 domain-containing protein [Pseudomonadota bacterium]